MKVYEQINRNRLRIASIVAVQFTEKTGWPCMPVIGPKNKLQYHTLVDGGLRVGNKPGEDNADI